MGIFFCFLFLNRAINYVLSLSLILIYLHRDEEGERWNALAETIRGNDGGGRVGATAKRRQKMVQTFVAYSFPFFNLESHCDFLSIVLIYPYRNKEVGQYGERSSGFGWRSKCSRSWPSLDYVPAVSDGYFFSIPLF